MVIRANKFRIRPNTPQRGALARTLNLCQELYNCALEEKRTAYKRQEISLSKTYQQAELVELKEFCPEYADVYSQILQNVIARLHRAFDGFFSRVKQGLKTGFPRFKSKDRYDSFTFPQVSRPKQGSILSGGGVERLSNGRLKVHGVPGELKVIWHRELIGIPKTATFKREGKHWYVIFVCDNVPIENREKTGRHCALDLGIEAFATLDDGSRIENPRFLQKSQNDIVKKQRAMERGKRGSNRRKKSQALLSNAHRAVTNARRDFHHKTARSLINRFDTIAIEDLNILGLARGMLSKQFADVGIGQFVDILSSKAEGAGVQVIKADPDGTSQLCASCGKEVKKPLSQRMHTCPHEDCGFTAHRDLNAALNIYQRAYGHKRPGCGLRGSTSTGADA